MEINTEENKCCWSCIKGIGGTDMAFSPWAVINGMYCISRFTVEKGENTFHPKFEGGYLKERVNNGNSFLAVSGDQ